MSPRTRTSLFLDEHLKAGLRALKARDGMPEAEAVRRAVADFLKGKGIELANAAKTAPRRASTRRKA